MTDVLQIRQASGGYHSLTVFRGVDLNVASGEVVGIVGPNGSGKTTLLKTIAGSLPLMAGTVDVGGQDVSRARAFQRARHGIALVPEGRQIFSDQTVLGNLRLARAAQRLSPDAFNERLEEVFTIFPRLRERASQPGGSLSGGEQQMLAIGRGMLLDPQILLLDEPTQGLAPILVRQVLDALHRLRGRFSMIVVEQNRPFTEVLSDRVFEMKAGRLELADIPSSQ